MESDVQFWNRIEINFLSTSIHLINEDYFLQSVLICRLQMDVCIPPTPTCAMEIDTCVLYASICGRQMDLLIHVRRTRTAESDRRVHVTSICGSLLHAYFLCTFSIGREWKRALRFYPLVNANWMSLLISIHAWTPCVTWNPFGLRKWVQDFQFRPNEIEFYMPCMSSSWKSYIPLLRTTHVTAALIVRFHILLSSCFRSTRPCSPFHLLLPLYIYSYTLYYQSYIKIRSTGW